MKKLLVFLCAVTLVFGVVHTASALSHISTFNITQADFSLTGFSTQATLPLPTPGPDNLLINNVTGTYNLDIPAAGGLWDVYIAGSLWADFNEDGTPDDYLNFDEYVGNYASPGHSTSWGPGSILFTAEYNSVFYDFTLDYDVSVGTGAYPSGNFDSDAKVDLTLSGVALNMLMVNTYLTNLDNLSGGGDGVIDGWIGGELTVTCSSVPEPCCAMLLLGAGLAGLVGLSRKKFFKK